MSYLEYNSIILEARFPHVISKLDLGNTNEVEGHNNDEPIDKDVAWLQAVGESICDCKIVFVYGFGRGLSIADLLDQYPDRWFFVYEPDANLFYRNLFEYDLSLILQHPNFYWLSVGQPQLEMLFHMVCSYMQDEMAFVALRHYLERDMEALRGIKDKFLQYRETFFENKFTENRFREDWTQNFLYHISDTLNTPSIEQAFHAFKGVTAVVVSSGPSLRDDIDYLKKLKSHVLIIAAGSSIQALISHGIIPHLAVILDGHPINMKIFSNPEALKCPLLFTTSSYYEVSDLKATEKIHSIMKSDAVSQYLLNIDKDDLLIYPTATVAGTAIQAAFCLGAERILLMGQDLSFPNQKYYAEGIKHFSTDTVNMMLQTATKEVPNVKGGFNLTDESFLSMKDNIEKLISLLPNIEFINTSRHGAVIEGAPFRPIEEVYDKLLSGKVESNAVGDWIRNHFSVKDRQRILHVREKMELTLIDILAVRSEIKIVQKHMGKLRELSRTKPPKAQKELELIEQLWGAIANRAWFAPIIESIMPLKISQFDQLLPSIIMEQNLIRKTDLIYNHLGQLLTSIDETIPSLQEIFVEALHRMDQIEVVQ